MKEFAYDITQYESFPYSQTHPEHLYTIAHLFGIKAPHYKHGRILELGCAAGGNIIPVAYNYPDAYVIGIDYSKKQVEAGQKQIESLGLDNISIKHASIADVDADFGMFDYIICHGVYSWVSEEIREKILDVIRNNLVENGVAYVSYNTLPGWNAVKSYRDMMRYHIRDFETSEEKAEQARSILKFMVEGQSDSFSPYASFLKTEYDLLAERSDSYLLHDHLADVNSPVYFYEFMESAEKKDLYYLADTPVSIMFPYNLPENVATELNEISDIVKTGQYMDFFRNQRFRCTLLCKKNTGKENIKRTIHVEDIENYYITFDGKIHDSNDTDIISDNSEIICECGAVSFGITNQISKAAFKILSERKLKPIAFNELCKSIMALTAIDDHDKVRYHLNEELNLMRLVFAGILGIHSEPGNYLTGLSNVPAASMLARLQAKGQFWVTNQRHESVSLNLFDRTMIQYMDGTRTLQQIEDVMIQHICNGDLEIFDSMQVKITDREIIEETAKQLCKTMMDYSLNNALLIE